ncbi:DUF2335 domain-containing protein [Maribacter dokdonensis]|uniref:DUF2335 domain-containing protein n=1 Tax=Maribacter dokdonensis TaxID=320912 RepID=UPI00329923D1
MSKRKPVPSKNQKKEVVAKKEDDSEEIPVEVAKVIKDLPIEKQQTVIKALSIKKHYSGPLPDGESIKIYNEVIPDGGNRLMSTVEKQLEHRINVENIGVRRTFNQSSTGQWMGFIIAIVFGFISWDLAKSGFTVAASILGTVDLVALVAIFITGKLSK